MVTYQSTKDWLTIRRKLYESQGFFEKSYSFANGTIGVSLRSRRFEVVGERENGRARGIHARGEGAPARKVPENRFNSHSVSADISNWSRDSREKN